MTRSEHFLDIAANIFLYIAAYVTDAAAINLNGVKTLLVNVLSTFTFKANPLF